MILHVDMDAFFAAVERLDDPSLAGCCLVVGSSSDRGVVAAASYEARRFGIHSAMPMFQARRRCRDLVIVPPRRQRYQQLSRAIMAHLAGYTPLVEKVSIDEAFLDVSGCRKLFGTPAQMATRIKTEIRDRFGLSCSIGVAPLKFLAKIASDMQKPDGLTLVSADEVDTFIARLPVTRIPGVGRRTREQLEQMGLRRMADVRRIPRRVLVKKMGKFGQRLFELSRGIDRSRVTPWRAVKSISEEKTLARDTSDRQFLKKIVLQQSEAVGRRLRKSGFKARTVNLKLKFADFQQITRQSTLERATRSSTIIFSHAAALLAAAPLRKRVRLVGVGVAGLLAAGTPEQACLFGHEDLQPAGWERIDAAVDAVASKYGSQAIRKATLID
jgi:DNA polymerase-4